MGSVIAGLAGWTPSAPTLTDDGLGLPIGCGVLVIVLITGAFLALNIPIGRKARIPASQWIPTAVAVSLLAAVAAASQLHDR